MKQTTKKRWACIALAALLTIPAAGCSVQMKDGQREQKEEKESLKFVAITTDTAKELTFILKPDDTYEVTGINRLASASVVIPAEHQGKPVTSIGAATSVSMYVGNSSGSFVINSKDNEGTDSSYTLEKFYTSNSPVTSISIPASVTTIARNAFDGCLSLTDIYFAGTEEQWNTILANSGWGAETPDCTVHFS